MGVNFELAVKADYIAGHIRKKEGGELPLMMYHDKAYDVLTHNPSRATDILFNYQMEVERDIKSGVCKASTYFEKER